MGQTLVEYCQTLQNFDEVFERGKVPLPFFNVVSKSFFWFKHLAEVLGLEQEVQHEEVQAFNDPRAYTTQSADFVRGGAFDSGLKLPCDVLKS